MTAMAMTVTTSKNSRLLDITTGKKQQPVQFSFNDTSFVYKDLSTRTCPYCPTTFSHSLTCTHPIDSLDVHVPLSHVLSAGISDSVVDVNVLAKGRSGFQIVKLSESFQADNAEIRSSVNDWVQAAMSAAYTGASRAIHTIHHK